jgi:integrase/recombinase XerD
MFDQLFRYPAVLRRHRDGPLAHERATFLTSLAIQGSATGTLLKCARYCLAIAHVLQARPPDHVFTTSEIDVLARAWAVDRVQHRRAVGPRWPHQQFRAVATAFLTSLGRSTPSTKISRPYAREVDDFVTAEQRDRLRSATTCANRR